MKWVKTSQQKPPQWILDAVKEKWGVVWESNVIFTYNGVISTSSGEMTEDLIAHENTHIEQQARLEGWGDEWWKRYLADDQFRFEQELEAYQNQYKWLVRNIKDRNEVFRFLTHYAKSLSGAMYGNMCDFHTAWRKIKGVEK